MSPSRCPYWSSSQPTGGDRDALAQKDGLPWELKRQIKRQVEIVANVQIFKKKYKQTCEASSSMTKTNQVNNLCRNTYIVTNVTNTITNIVFAAT